MNKILIVILVIVFASCHSNLKSGYADSLSAKNNDSIKSRIRDSINKRKTIDSLMLLGNRPDSLQATPTPAEEMEEIKRTYDQITIIDSTFIVSNDTLHFHLKYYCLKNSNLVVSKSYYTDEKNAKDFVTHAFASDILLINNRDTVLKKQFKASDFSPFYQDNFGGSLKKNGSIFMPTFVSKNKDKSRIVLDYPISIPITDIGIGLFLIISKDGTYKIADHY